MSETNLTPDRFFEEVKAWGATPGSLIKVRIMQIGKNIYCRLKLPNNGEIIQTTFTRTQYDNFYKMNLSGAVPAVWEIEKIKSLNEKLVESINASNQKFTPNSYKNIRY